MEIEYNNRVTGFDFRTQSATLTIEGTCRKNTESGALTEFFQDMSTFFSLAKIKLSPISLTKSA